MEYDLATGKQSDGMDAFPTPKDLAVVSFIE